MDKLTLLLEKTNEAKKLLDFPILKQRNSYNGVISAVNSILIYYGDDCKEDELISKLKNTESTLTINRQLSTINNITNFFIEKDYSITPKQMNVNDIINYINDDIPVMLFIQSWGNIENYIDEWNYGHYVVAIGYTSNKILFEDPKLSNIGYLSFKELEQRWHFKEDETKYINFGISIKGGKPKFNKNKWIKID